MAKFKPKPKIPDAEKENTERWLLTYADMITLLMLFFIVLWSMSQTDPKKFDETTEALRNALSGSHFGYVFSASNTASNKDAVPLGAAQRDIIKALRERRDALKVMLESRLKTSAIPVTNEIREINDGLRLTLTGAVFFKPGESTLTEVAREALKSVSANLFGITNNIRFEGHADPQPNEPAEGPDNWELSSARAISTLHYFEDQGFSPQRLQALAFGQYKDMVSSDTKEDQSYNRRVDIVILWDTQESYTSIPLPAAEKSALPENPVSPANNETGSESTSGGGQ